MARITFKNQPVNTSGSLPATGSTAPDFRLTTAELNDVSLSDYAGKKKILNIVPSLDTGVCATSARRFDREVARLADTVCLTISADLPFASSRFCKSEGVTNVVTLSELRDRSFGADYGCRMTDGPLAGLLSRAVVVLDENNKVLHTEQVPEITQEPDYDGALKAAG
ncbi:MAG: thiol peroxidase [Spirochaetaceae bacterium]|nr:MAG: thiol peroxidase [Spirochaetaceae bacterium]